MHELLTELRRSKDELESLLVDLEGLLRDGCDYPRFSLLQSLSLGDVAKIWFKAERVEGRAEIVIEALHETASAVPWSPNAIMLHVQIQHLMDPVSRELPDVSPMRSWNP